MWTLISQSGQRALWLVVFLLTMGAAWADATRQTPADLAVQGRRIVTFRATLGGDPPAERVRLAQAGLSAHLAKPSGAQVARVVLTDGVRIDVNGEPIFYLVGQDLAVPRGAAELQALADDAAQRLQTSLQEREEAYSPKALGMAALRALAATAVAYGLLRGIWWARRRTLAALYDRVRQLHRPEGASEGGLPASLAGAYAEHLRSLTRWLAVGASWLLALVVVEAWATFVLHQFPQTRPWAERSTAWTLELLSGFAESMANAVPGLLTAGLIFLLARGSTRLLAVFLDRVASGDLEVSWLDRDTAIPTRRLASVAIWLFAMAMAYPYLPGSGSEAFKGVSVLAGVMLSLGASSVVGQMLSGLSLMYSRSVRVGEYVKVGDTEGTVVHMGLFTTRVHTGMGEEVSLPNTVVFSQPIRNFSRLVADGQFVLHTAVTIGYATPWRQVHAMLLEAARRTPGVANEPSPYVVQTALSDFYVEYRLCCQSNRLGPSRRAQAMSELHAHVQDVFNEHGVQIMSPHYMADPPTPQVVTPGGDWGGPELTSRCKNG